jgi:catechol 2,3-dioxygenase-like lactoylglutathione lyase family enzyme
VVVKGIAHVCYVVKDLEKAIRFYCDALKLKLAFEFLDDLQFHLVGVLLPFPVQFVSSQRIHQERLSNEFGFRSPRISVREIRTSFSR